MKTLLNMLGLSQYWRLEWMAPSSMKIRRAEKADIEAIVQITRDNEHFWSPAVDGPEALARVISREDNIVLVSMGDGKDGEITGFLIGTWDGARAFIHKLSVSPAIQHKGTGMMLVAAGIEEFKKKGAPTVGVSAADGTRPDDEENDSTGFWKKIGFEYIPARLMINFSIWGEDEEDHGQIKENAE